MTPQSVIVSRRHTIFHEFQQNEVHDPHAQSQNPISHHSAMHIPMQILSFA
jgi:hypothetical protein